MLRKLLFCITALFFIHTMNAVTIYHPRFSRIDLVCGVRPSASDTDIVFCGAAAFTRIYGWTEFSHDLIADDHVSGGVLYTGYACPETETTVGNTGTFVWYDGQWQILPGDAPEAKQLAQQHGGMAFSEELIVQNGRYHYNLLTERYRNKAGFYRVLADLNGVLTIIESETLTFGAFVDELLLLGVRNALFIDMGSVRYSFVREEGVLHELGTDKKDFPYASNWIVFYK